MLVLIYDMSECACNIQLESAGLNVDDALVQLLVFELPRDQFASNRPRHIATLVARLLVLLTLVLQLLFGQLVP